MRAVCVLGLAMGCPARADRPPSPFTISPSIELTNGQATVRFKFHVPAEHIVYADRLKFLNDEGEPFTPSQLPPPAVGRDKSDGHEKRMYDGPFVAELTFPLVPTNIVIRFQGCSNSACYFPEKKPFRITAQAVTPIEPEPAPPEDEPKAGDWLADASQFKIVARATGYMGAGSFLSFLEKAQSGESTSEDPLSRYRHAGMLVTVFLIFLGGLGLNFTPCVLPLIPINLAIIHGGRTAHSRAEGFRNGAAYGAGMALVYGVLGVAVVLTGSRFGALNASPWFNVAIAVIFAVLSLAMFDVFHIDFARLDRGLGRKGTTAARGRNKQWLVAFTLGAIAALLAGACVAPVVISVLLLATDLYGRGAIIGLALPFLLGLGMAIPWPLMGASLSFLPKPGRWMVFVKYAFGILILLFAGYYGHTAYGGFRNAHATTALASAPAGSAAPAAQGDQILAKALQESRASGRPVFIDFAASWCKNCVAMDETVFNQARVKERLNTFIVVRYEAERPNENPARAVLDHFRILGLPTYVVLAPEKRGSPLQAEESAAHRSSNSSL